MDNHSHLTMSSLDEMTTEQLNQLIHDLSVKSRERYNQESWTDEQWDEWLSRFGYCHPQDAG